MVTKSSKISKNWSDALAEITEEGEDTGLNIASWFKKGPIDGTDEQKEQFRLCSFNRFQELGKEISAKNTEAKKQLDDVETENAPDSVVMAIPSKKRRRTTKLAASAASDLVVKAEPVQ